MENYQKFLKAHPKAIGSIVGEQAFTALIEAGEKPEMIIAAAKEYAETVRHYSSIIAASWGHALCTNIR